MTNRENAEKVKKRNDRKKIFRVLLEVALMVLGILCSIMPAPFPLLVPIAIGMVRIVSNAFRKEKEPAPVVYCNGAKEPTKPAAKAEPKPNTKPKKQPQRKNSNDTNGNTRNSRQR